MVWLQRSVAPHVPGELLVKYRVGSDDAVTVKRPGDDTAGATAVLTERIRLAFESRIDEREPEAA